MQMTTLIETMAKRSLYLPIFNVCEIFVAFQNLFTDLATSSVL